jgi:hypothetical protein
MSLIGLILMTAVFKLVANTMEPYGGLFPAEAPETSRPILKQSNQQTQEFPASYYDSSSPHYMGGAHNVALQRLKEGNIP